MSDEKPRDFGGRGAFEVPAEAPAPTDPCEGAFDDPTARQQLEAFDAMWALGDFDRPRAEMDTGAGELLATINLIGEHTSHLGKALSQAFEQGDCAMDILHVGGMDVDGLRRGGALAIDYCSCWSRHASEFAASLSDQSSKILCHRPVSRQA
jgi:hypothetical protein